MTRKTKRSDDITLLATPALVTEAQDCLTVGSWLERAGFPRAATKRLFDAKQVLLNGHRVRPTEPVQVGDELTLQMLKEKLDYEPVPMELVVLYEDEDLLILDKPIGITVNSSGQVSIANGVAAYFLDNGIRRKVRFLNRLDRDTSGCLVIAKSGLAQSYYQRQIETDIMEKWYRTVVVGELTGVAVLEVPMRRSEDGIHYEVSDEGKLTRTAYNALGVTTRHGIVGTEVDVRLYTGKTHQIRVAMAHIGHPLLGDALYGEAIEGVTYELQAKRLSFVHMRTGERITVEAESEAKDETKP